MRELLFVAACSAPFAAWLWLIQPPGNTPELRGRRLLWSIVAGVIAFAVLLTLVVIVPIVIMIDFYVPFYSGI